MAVVATLSNHFKFQLASGNIDFDADMDVWKIDQTTNLLQTNID